MRRATIALAALVVVAGGRVACADPPDADRRADIEASFLDERFDDVLGFVRDDDPEPRFVLEAFWRPRSDETVPLATQGSLLSRRVAWLRGSAGGPYPMPAAGETDAYPRLTALVLDRVRREGSGAKGLPDESPLASIDDPTVREFLRRDTRIAFLGPDSALETADERALKGRVRDVASRNLAVAAGAVLALLLVAGAWLLVTRPRRGTGGGA